MSVLPIPIAIRLRSDVTLRGHEWPGDGMPVLFVHDFGEDLDVWGSTPATLSGAGFRVMSVELRGHGLSDGEPDPDTILDDLKDLVGEVAGSFGPVALVTHGSAAEAGLYLDETYGSPVHILVSPQPLDPAGIDWAAARPAMRILMVGATNEVAHRYAESIYPKMRGQNLWVSKGTNDQGPVLLAEHPNLVEQVVMFIRRYLTGYHLAWIAAHADEVGAATNPSDP